MNLKTSPIHLPDILPPKIFVLPGNYSVFNSTGFLLQYNISERSITEIYINNVLNGTTLASGTNMSYLTDGTYNITIKATDLSGNVGITSITVVIDSTAPIISFNNPTNTTYNNLAINVTYSIVESSNYTIKLEIVCNKCPNFHNLINIKNFILNFNLIFVFIICKLTQIAPVIT